jgi:undecaprenyl-diphosphatase
MTVRACGEKLGMIVDRFERLDSALCRSFNRGCRVPVMRTFFRVVSRLGDGVFWYALMAVFPLVAARDGVMIALHMGLTSLVGVAIYKLLKSRFVRERPYVNHNEIICAMPPLDRYSFPSGHTLHAISFSVIASTYYPPLVWVLMPFAILVALSRMILGLHYPTDVLVGAVIGGLLALAGFQLTGSPS